MNIEKMSAKGGSAIGGENKKPIILIIEDEPDILEMYAMAFSVAGFEVLQAKNGKEALEWLDKKCSEIKLILTDIVMPKMDGFEFMEEIRNDEKYKKIPIFVATNLTSDTDRQSAFAAGAKDIFEKAKWDPTKLAQKMKEIIGQ